MHTTFLGTLLYYLLASASAFVALGQENPPAAVVALPANPISAHTRLVHGGMKMALLGSAEKMPAENYDFRPAESVRSFGQIIGHVADSQYLFCSMALGEENPAPDIEKTTTSKSDLVAALKEAIAYCDRAYDGMTDASAADIVKLMGRDTPKLSVLIVNSIHNGAHYGNLVTYLRMKNIVPPTSEPEFMTKARQ